MKQDLEVTRKDEDQELVKQRMQTLKNKSIADLGTVTSFSDIPIPAPIENLFSSSKRSKSIDSKR